MTAVELRLTLLQEIATILDDEALVKKALTSIRRLKQVTTKLNTEEDREPTKEEMLESIKESFLELKAAREGKIQLRDAKELLNEL